MHEYFLSQNYILHYFCVQICNLDCPKKRWIMHFTINIFFSYLWIIVSISFYSIVLLIFYNVLVAAQVLNISSILPTIQQSALSEHQVTEFHNQWASVQEAHLALPNPLQELLTRRVTDVNLAGLLSNCSIWRAKFGRVWNWVFFWIFPRPSSQQTSFVNFFVSTCEEMKGWGETNPNFGLCIVMRFFRIIIIWYKPYCGLCIKQPLSEFAN